MLVSNAQGSKPNCNQVNIQVIRCQQEQWHYRSQYFKSLSVLTLTRSQAAELG